MATPEEQLKLKSLKTMRASVKGQMTKLATFVNGNPDPNDIDGFSSRLKRAKELLQQFCDTEQLIFELDPDETPKMPDFSETFYEVEAKLSKLIREYNVEVSVGGLGNGMSHNVSMIQNASVGQFNVTEIKLPKLELPEFRGEYRKWLPFYDFFVKTIHENQSLSSVQKFKYLKGALKGNAESLLRHISITDANYTESFNKLCQRFDRKKYIINDFVEHFCNQPNIKIATAENIRELMDTSDETIRGLKSLGRDAESRDPWLLYILVNKLDEETRILWAQECAQIDHPTIQLFLDFLLKRFDTLESLKACPKLYSKDHLRPTTRSHFMNNKTNANTSPCWLCEKFNHKLSDCTLFINMNITERRQLIKSANRCFNCLNGNHAVYQCSSKRRCSKCARKHHTSLHIDTTNSQTTKAHLNINEQSDDESQEEPTCSCKVNVNEPQSSTSTFHVKPTSTSAIIPTALVNVSDYWGRFHEGRMLLDSGSLASFVSEKFIRRLHVSRYQGRIMVKGLGNANVGMTKGVVNLCIKSLYDNNVSINIRAYVVKQITSKLPEFPINKSNLKHIVGLKLADPQFSVPSDVDILLNVQHFFEILRPGQIKGKKGQPVAQETSFGWVIGGEINQIQADSVSLIMAPSENTLDSLLKRFWEVESLQTSKPLSNCDLLCEEKFIQDRKIHNGHFQVKLLFKHDKVKLGDTYNLALSRLHAMERRFKKDVSFKELYVNFMTEYETLGHMHQVRNVAAKPSGYILPHHGVLKSSSTSTKLRVVFDASVKSSNGLSLNDQLLVGPTIQSTLYDILLRYRQHKIVFSADIEKMYRQVYVDPDHQQFQRILWRSDESQPIQIFELKTVTYGMACAPFLATRVLKQLSIDNANKYPLAAAILKNDVYVDDVMSGAETPEQALALQKEISGICSQAGFTLKKWVSNCENVLQSVSESDRVKLKKIDCDGSGELDVKVLGLHWDPDRDSFCFKVNLIPSSESTITKRILLSEVSKIFDPIGWLSPCVIRLKVLFQLLWLKSLTWDDELPKDVKLEWVKMRAELPLLELIEIPRWLQIEANQVELQIHGFCDASNNAYAAAVYARVQKSNGKITCNLITAKSRVAPIKQVTLARLELCGALMLANLMQNVMRALEISGTVWAWTDSTIVLDWLSDHPRRWPTFVANRTAEILEIIPRQQWRHVSSADNPADCASRGITPSQLNDHPLWWTGPSWLLSDETFWPQQKSQHNALCEPLTKSLISSTPAEQSSASSSILLKLIDRFSNFYSLLKVVCYLYRVYDKCKNQKLATFTTVSTEELSRATQIICREVQKNYFASEIRKIKSNEELVKTPLRFLNPILDENEVLRVGGRIRNATIPYSVKHPIILPSKTNLARMIVQHFHTKYYHADSTLMISLLRQQFWILRCRDLIKEIVHKCITCFRAKPRLEMQMMGDLPTHRVIMSHPFTKIGVDYAGPMQIYHQRRRGQKSFKAYICLFVCMVTKAAHIELVQDLTTDSFLGSVKRLVSRRGHCTDIFSDCGSNFIGANNQLVEVYKFLNLNTNIISNSLLSDNIQWHFNPPSAPHMGGLWESAVKATKYHLTRVIGDTILTSEELQTLLVEIEGILNSRPLCVLADDQLDALTPAHLIIGRPIIQLPERNIMDEKCTNLKRWEHVQFMKQHFWNRWHKEYLTSLQKRNKWLSPKENLKVGDLVIIKDDNLPSTQWRYGLIEKVHPGKDNLVRVATVKVSSGIMQRPIHKLCKLPTH